MIKWSKSLLCLFMWLCLCVSTAFANAPVATSVWEHAVPDAKVWERLAKSQKTEVFSKFVVDVKTGSIYYLDAHVFEMHVDFVLGYLQKQPRTRDNLIAYNLNYEREKPQFVLGYLTHYPNIGEWVFSFWEGDKISAAQIAQVKKVLDQTFFIQSLKFRPDSPAQEQEAQLATVLGVPFVSNDTLYKAQPYQALNLGSAIGYLRVLPKGEAIDSMALTPDDIVILQDSYPDIAPVAGIITTKFSTPLSHVNLRASAWGIPNAGYQTATRDYAKLAGQLVSLNVGAEKMTLRAANAQERQWFKQHKRQHKKVTLPAAILNDATLLNLRSMRQSDARRYGAKAANLGGIVQAKLEGVRVPEGFGIPFYYYQQHIKHHRIDRQIARVLKKYARSGHQTNQQAHYRQELQALQQAIMAAPLDSKMLDAVEQKIQTELGGVGVFVRSSTNAEDLRGFNGAGLYDTVPNVRGRAALEAAIKQVWASVWNWRAVQERYTFGLNHAQVYPAVLIQQAVNASAAGVLVTQDLWGNQPGSYTINAKWGLGMRVVEGQKIPEQVIFDVRNNGMRILSRSDESTMLVVDQDGGVKEVQVPNATGILSEPRVAELAGMATRLLPVFALSDKECASNLSANEWANSVTDCQQPLDIEWVLEGEQFWIVQARPYVKHH